MKRAKLNTCIRLGLVSAMLGVAGCASLAPSQSQPLTDDLIHAYKGNFVGLYNTWLRPQTQYRNRKADGTTIDVMKMTDIDSMRATEAGVSKDFGRFCAASGGTLDVQPNKYGQKNVCSDASGTYLGEIDTTRYPQGLAFAVDSREAREIQAMQQKAAEQARRKQDYARLAPGSVDALSGAELNALIIEFEGNDPQNLLPRAKARRDALLAKAVKEAGERDRRQLAELQAARAAKARAQENRQIGDQVCYVSHDTAISQPTGMVVLGQEQYREVRGTGRAVGFVEGINRANGKIQIRISGITFSAYGRSESMDSWSNFKNGLTLQVNSVIWDDTHDWDGC